MSFNQFLFFIQFHIINLSTNYSIFYSFFKRYQNRNKISTEKSSDLFAWKFDRNKGKWLLIMRFYLVLVKIFCTRLFSRLFIRFRHKQHKYPELFYQWIFRSVTYFQSIFFCFLPYQRLWMLPTTRCTYLQVYNQLLLLVIGF